VGDEPDTYDTDPSPDATDVPSEPETAAADAVDDPERSDPTAYAERVRDHVREASRVGQQVARPVAQLAALGPRLAWERG
jgi:hypothetical protein